MHLIALILLPRTPFIRTLLFPVISYHNYNGYIGPAVESDPDLVPKHGRSYMWNLNLDYQCCLHGDGIRIVTAFTARAFGAALADCRSCVM